MSGESVKRLSVTAPNERRRRRRRRPSGREKGDGLRVSEGREHQESR